jgi:hypothetical protein
MKESEILQLARENLENFSRIKMKWSKEQLGYLDALVEVVWDEGKSLSFHAEVKNSVGLQHLDQIKQLSKENKDFLLVSVTLSSAVKEKLRENHISYLEANGNMHLERGQTLLWIETQKPLVLKKGEPGNRAFTRTGLKVLFHFLLHPEWISLSYREMAEKTGTSLGNLSNILNSLVDSGFLLRKSKTELIWNNRKQLIDKWIGYYQDILKPSLFLGAFRFVNEAQTKDWKNLSLQPGQSWWGSEPAADLLTNYLYAGEWTLYTRESKQDLIKNYRMIPDLNGPVKAYRAFWTFDHPGPIAPALLVYADLINTGNSRCVETAQYILNELLKGPVSPSGKKALLHHPLQNNLGDLIGQWPGDESFEDLLKQLSP